MNFDYNRLYLTSEGRIGRQDFWMGLVGLLVVGIVVSLIIGALFGMVSFSARLLKSTTGDLDSVNLRAAVPLGGDGWRVGASYADTRYSLGSDFANLQALETMCKGRMIADLVAVIGSIDIVLGEIDR